MTATQEQYQIISHDTKHVPDGYHPGHGANAFYWAVRIGARGDVQLGTLRGPGYGTPKEDFAFGAEFMDWASPEEALDWLDEYGDDDESTAFFREVVLRHHFEDIVDRYGNIAEISRRGGIHRTTIEKKLRGDRPVRTWDVWAVRGALQEKLG